MVEWLGYRPVICNFIICATEVSIFIRYQYNLKCSRHSYYRIKFNKTYKDENTQNFQTRAIKEIKSSLLNLNIAITFQSFSFYLYSFWIFLSAPSEYLNSPSEVGKTRILINVFFLFRTDERNICIFPHFIFLTIYFPFTLFPLIKSFHGFHFVKRAVQWP